LELGEQVITELTDQLRTAAVLQQFASEFDVEQVFYLPKRLSEIQRLTINTCLAGEEDDRLTRGNHFETAIAVQVGVRQRVKSHDVAAINALVSLTRQLRLWLWDAEPADRACIECSQQPLYDPELLRDRQVFFAVINSKFR
jgi:hypothetical protein